VSGAPSRAVESRSLDKIVIVSIEASSESQNFSATNLKALIKERKSNNFLAYFF